MHPSEHARIIRDLHADPSVPGEQAIRSGSPQEELALAAIDSARAQELARLDETPRSRRREMALRLRRTGLSAEELGRA